jgi:hypothetical protein
MPGRAAVCLPVEVQEVAWSLRGNIDGAVVLDDRRRGECRPEASGYLPVPDPAAVVRPVEVQAVRRALDGDQGPDVVCRDRWRGHRGPAAGHDFWVPATAKTENPSTAAPAAASRRTYPFNEYRQDMRAPARVGRSRPPLLKTFHPVTSRSLPASDLRPQRPAGRKHGPVGLSPGLREDLAQVVEGEAC